MDTTSCDYFLIHLKRFTEVCYFLLLLVLRTNHKEIHNNEHGYQHNPHHATTTGRINRAVPKLFACMRSTVDDVMDGVGLPLLGVVPDDASVTLAAAEGKPLVQYTYHGAALACLHIAKRLCGQRVPLMKITR